VSGCAAVLLFCLAVDAVAREAVVRTREGKIYQGQIRFETNQVIVVNAAREYVLSIEWTNLWALSFKMEAATPIAEETIGPGELPQPWQHAELGRVETAGRAAYAAGLFRLSSSGTNILGEVDAFNFVYQPLAGDSEIIARVIHAQRAAPSAKAGLMMRENLRSDSPNVFFGVTPLSGGVVQWREAAGQETIVADVRDLSTPLWIKLKREGDSFSGYKSRNGRQWGLVEKLSLPMANAIYVGLALAAVKTDLDSAEAKLSHCTMDNVRAASPSIPISSFVPRVVSQSGSTIMGPIERADDKAIHFPPEQWREPLPARAVASILFQWTPHRFNSVFKAGRPGVLLANGEFAEGDFKVLEKGRVQLSSVLFGLRSLDANNEVLAVVLRKPILSRHEFEVKTLDGSVWLGTGLKFSPGEVVMNEAALGSRRIPIHELQEIRRRR
jgi:hypothetical protein